MNAPAPTDRGMWLLVARRDFRVRIRDKGFLISTLITLTVLSVFILIRAHGGGGTPSYDLGIVGPGGTGGTVVEVGRRQGVAVTLHGYTDAGAAERALRSGDVDAVLEHGRLQGSQEPSPELVDLVETAAVAKAIRDALSKAGVSDDRIAEVLNPRPVVVETLEPPDPDRDANAAVAFVGVLLLYGQLFGYGVWVATGVIEEKSSRVVEILLSAIRPRQLLAGKVAGIGLLGIAQLAFIALFAIALASVTGALAIPASAFGTAGLVLIWFVLGFAFYAGLFAVSGSLVSRMEELQNAMVPINLIIFASFFISIGALENPDTTLAKVASMLPFSSALAMPVRIVLGSAGAAQIALSVALLVGSTLLLVPLAGRLYAGAILRTGARVKLRDAWRAVPTRRSR